MKDREEISAKLISRVSWACEHLLRMENGKAMCLQVLRECPRALPALKKYLKDLPKDNENKEDLLEICREAERENHE